MTFFFWLGKDAEEWNQIHQDYDGDWEAWQENVEMTNAGY